MILPGPGGVPLIMRAPRRGGPNRGFVTFMVALVVGPLLLIAMFSYGDAIMRALHVP